MTLHESERIPPIDLTGETERHIIIARGTEQVYQGHPTTLLMPDGKTMFCVWCINHGGHCGPMARSDDGGLTWSTVDTPANWLHVYNCPSIYLLEDPKGKQRLFVFAARSEDEVAMQQSVSEDGGHTWSPFRSLGMPCIMAFTTIIRLKSGDYLGLYPRGKDDRDQSPLKIWQSLSKDGGVTWEEPSLLVEDSARGRDPDEPELVRSPNGSQLLVLFRENLRKGCSLMVVSADEGVNWTDLRETPWGLTGDRHKAKYAPDGRLVVVFRDMAPESPSKGSFVAWVGTFEDIVAGNSGQYRIKLLHQHVEPRNERQLHDCGYPGLELLADGTFVATTYVKYEPGPTQNSVVSVRFKLDEVDARRQARTGADPGETASLF